jgi:hypothetical protein
VLPATADIQTVVQLFKEHQVEQVADNEADEAG